MWRWPPSSAPARDSTPAAWNGGPRPGAPSPATPGPRRRWPGRACRDRGRGRPVHRPRHAGARAGRLITWAVRQSTPAGLAIVWVASPDAHTAVELAHQRAGPLRGCPPDRFPARRVHAAGRTVSGTATFSEGSTASGTASPDSCSRYHPALVSPVRRRHQ